MDLCVAEVAFAFKIEISGVEREADERTKERW